MNKQFLNNDPASFQKEKQSFKPYKAFVPTEFGCSCLVSFFMPHVSHVFSLLFTGATLYAGCENGKEKGHHRLCKPSDRRWTCPQFYHDWEDGPSLVFTLAQSS